MSTAYRVEEHFQGHGVWGDEGFGDVLDDVPKRVPRFRPGVRKSGAGSAASGAGTLSGLTVPMRPHRCEVLGRKADVRSKSVPKMVKSSVGKYEFAEPMKEVKYDVGFNCVIPVRIGNSVFRMCVDTGGGRSMIRKEFSDKLQKNSHTCKQVLQRNRIIDEVRCTGVCDGMSSATLDFTALVQLTLDPVREDGGKPPPPVDFQLEMGELPNASDSLLMGFPDIVRHQIKFYDDADGNIWVDWGVLGVTVLAERRRQDLSV